MKLNRINVLSKDEILTIHSAAIELLSTVGIKIDAQDTRDLLEKHGAEVDQETTF
ncbi:MAG: trimethylamine methyltransferase family protein, partial [Candidatus Lokiarchaeota archaeon]|nr:trimethylamine methyltransferase family protein [Candidatus Lokiarchaeota archaeon]